MSGIAEDDTVQRLWPLHSTAVDEKETIIPVLDIEVRINHAFRGLTRVEGVVRLSDESALLIEASKSGSVVNNIVFQDDSGAQYAFDHIRITSWMIHTDAHVMIANIGFQLVPSS